MAHLDDLVTQLSTYGARVALATATLFAFWVAAPGSAPCTHAH